MMIKPSIEIRDIVFKYNHSGFQLSVPELSIETGEQVAVVGPSGSGKTTLAYLIAGILTPSQGEIVVDGNTVSAMTCDQRRNFRASNIGLIFQEFELLEYLTVEENILLPYHINRSLTLSIEARSSAKELAATVGLGKKLTRKPDELSQGEKQRLAICRALVTNPNIIMADEPTGSLDSDTTESIMELIDRQVKRRDATFFMITHDRGLLDKFDKVVDLQTLLGEVAK